MLKRILPVMALLLLCSHDMFLKSDPYFFEPNTSAELHLYNGTFDTSENSIARDRMLDVSLLGNGKRTAVDTIQWRDADGMTILQFTTGQAGTWVAGVSTRARNIALSATDFNDYLEHDGVLDMLALRREKGLLEADAHERYSKHVKSIFQVGEQLTDDWKTPLGYPIEFIPLQNPYDLHPGHTMSVQLLLGGEPLANQPVYIGKAPSGGDTGESHRHGPEGEHTHEDAGTPSHTHEGVLSLRTDEAGKLEFELDTAGAWYLRTIHMVEVDEESITHESNWATLTFAVGQGHSHEHEAEHAHESDGVPGYVYWLGSLVLLGLLFFWFNRKK